MKKYKILVIALLLKNNEVAKYGDVVSGNKFTRSVEDLIEEKYIEEVAEEVSDSVGSSVADGDQNEPPTDPPVQPSIDNQDPQTDTVSDNKEPTEKKNPVDIVKGGKK